MQVRDRLGRSGREDWGGGQFVESAESEFNEGFVWDMGGVEVGGYVLEDFGGEGCQVVGGVGRVEL